MDPYTPTVLTRTTAQRGLRTQRAIGSQIEWKSFADIKRAASHRPNSPRRTLPSPATARDVPLGAARTDDGDRYDRYGDAMMGEHSVRAADFEDLNQQAIMLG